MGFFDVFSLWNKWLKIRVGEVFLASTLSLSNDQICGYRRNHWLASRRRQWAEQEHNHAAHQTPSFSAIYADKELPGNFPAPVLCEKRVKVACYTFAYSHRLLFSARLAWRENDVNLFTLHPRQYLNPGRIKPGHLPPPADCLLRKSRKSSARVRHFISLQGAHNAWCLHSGLCYARAQPLLYCAPSFIWPRPECVLNMQQSLFSSPSVHFACAHTWRWALHLLCCCCRRPFGYDYFIYILAYVCECACEHTYTRGMYICKRALLCLLWEIALNSRPEWGPERANFLPLTSNWRLTSRLIA